jgi:succinate dehydrogenase flavin-adding protein (antitoxin of CptAB toxin-antitoxin module)
MHSASLDSAAPQTSAQLQQQQTEQQRTRQQSHPQQQQHSNHIKAIQQDPDLRRKVLVNRLLYRSRQRGFLEMDLLVGIWAEKQIPQLSENMLQQFEIVLDQENPDLYKWLTGQEQPPQDVAENAAYQVHKRQHLLFSHFPIW